MDTVSISCLALAHIGMKPITSMSGTDPSSLACTRYFEPCRNEVFRDFKWPFALFKGTLSTATELDSDDIIDWTYFYYYPSSAAMVWNVYNEATTATKDEQDYEIIYWYAFETLSASHARQVICTDLSDAYVEYTYKVQDPARWDDKFVMAFSYRLAAAIAKELTGDDDKALKMGQAYSLMIHDCKRLAQHEKKKKPPKTSAYVNARG